MPLREFSFRQKREFSFRQKREFSFLLPRWIYPMPLREFSFRQKRQFSFRHKRGFSFRLRWQFSPEVPRRLLAWMLPRPRVRVTFPFCFQQIPRIFSVTVRRFSSRVTPRFSRLVASRPLPRFLAPWLSSRLMPFRESFPSCVWPLPRIFSVTVSPTFYSCSLFFRVQIYN